MASRRLAKEGGPTSKSRVAIITGLPRSEVTKLSKFVNTRRRTRAGQQPARRTLTGWFNDPSFLSANGEPAVLPIFGKRRSFEKLVSKYGAGIPVRAMLDELIQIGAIERLSDQRVSAKTRVPISVGLTPSPQSRQSRELQGLIRHTYSKISVGSTIQCSRRLHLSPDASSNMLPVIRREIAEQGTNLINAASSILKRSQGRAKKRTPNRDGRRVGVTVYYFEDSAGATGDLAKDGKITQRTNLRRK